MPSIADLPDELVACVALRLGPRDALALAAACRAARGALARSPAVWEALWAAWRRRHRPSEASLLALAATPRTPRELLAVAARRRCDRRGCARPGVPRWAVAASLCDPCFALATVSDAVLAVELCVPFHLWCGLPHEFAHFARAGPAAATRLYLREAVGPELLERAGGARAHVRGGARARRRREVARLRRERADAVLAAVGPGEPTRAEAVALAEWGDAPHRDPARDEPIWAAVRDARARADELAARRAALEEALAALGLEPARAIEASPAARAALRYGRAPTDAVLARILGEAG